MKTVLVAFFICTLPKKEAIGAPVDVEIRSIHHSNLKFYHHNINACSSNPCVNSKGCTDEVANYSCDCEDGWEGKNCDMKAPNSIDNLCDGFDAVTVVDHEIFIFKNGMVWKSNNQGDLEDGYPVPQQDEFPGIPSTAIDAAAVTVNDKIILFIGKDAYIHDGMNILSRKTLEDYGISANNEKIDVAFLWDEKESLYLFRENSYWIYDLKNDRPFQGYPSSVSGDWGTVIQDMDAAIYDDNIYTFKGRNVYEYDPIEKKLSEGFPMDLQTSSFEGLVLSSSFCLQIK